MIHCLYKTTNKLNGRYYIGIHSTNDSAFGTEYYIDDYCGSGEALLEALKKYGRISFVVEVLNTFKTRKAAIKAEERIVTKKLVVEEKGIIYNIIPGGYVSSGHNGLKHSVATKKLMSRIRQGNHYSPSTEFQAGVAQPKVICPYCGTVGGNRTMKRWHFYNCRIKA